MNLKNILSPLIAAAVLAALTSCASTGNAPIDEKSTTRTIKETVPGGIIVNTVKVNAVVTDIDKMQRTAVLIGKDKKLFTVKVGPEAVNFDKISKGDKVVITLVSELAVSVFEKGKTVDDVSTETVSISPDGKNPGGIAVKTKQVVGTVTAINLKQHTATLKFADKTKKTFNVRKDVDLSKHKKGEIVVFRVTEMFAIDVVKQ